MTVCVGLLSVVTSVLGQSGKLVGCTEGVPRAALPHDNVNSAREEDPAEDKIMLLQ